MENRAKSLIPVYGTDGKLLFKFDPNTQTIYHRRGDVETVVDLRQVAERYNKKKELAEETSGKMFYWSSP